MKLISKVVPVRTRAPREFVDITPSLSEAVETAGVKEGLLLVRSRHTTAAVACNEGDPTVHQDSLDLLDDLMPRSRGYRHSYEGVDNARAHLGQMMAYGHTTWAPIRSGRIDLGTWQRIFLVELFEPRNRSVDVVILGE